MAEANSASTTPYKEEGLTKEESLEYQLWSLQVSFEELLRDDRRTAAKFLVWARRTFANAPPPGNSKVTVKTA